MSKNLICVLLLLPLAALADQGAPPPGGTVITLDAQAVREVSNDLMRIAYFVELEDADPARLAAQVNSAADEAVRIAKQLKGAKVQTSGYSTYPVRDKSNRIVRWRARYEFSVEGKDFKELSELTGRLQQSVQVAGVWFSVSPEARAKAEEALIDEAVTSFRARAALIAKSAGIGPYRIREMAVSAEGHMPPRPMARTAMVPMEAAPAPAFEAGVSTITLRIAGSIESPPPVPVR